MEVTISATSEYSSIRTTMDARSDTSIDLACDDRDVSKERPTILTLLPPQDFVA